MYYVCCNDVVFYLKLFKLKNITPQGVLNKLKKNQ